MTSQDPFPSGRRIRMVGAGRKVTGVVPSRSCPASQVLQCCYSIRDGGAVTGVSGWDPGHIHCGNGGPTPPVLGAVAEWLTFNAFVRRAVGWRGRLSLVPRDGHERGGDVLRGRGSRGEPSSKAEFVTHSRVDPLPSSEAELVQRALEGPSSAAEIVSRVRGGCEWPHAGLL